MEVRQVAAWRKDVVGFSDILQNDKMGGKEIKRVPGLRATLNISLGDHGEKSQSEERKYSEIDHSRITTVSPTTDLQRLKQTST